MTSVAAQQVLHTGGVRLPEEVTFALEVIFDDQLVQFARFLEQGLAPLCRNRDRGRDLVAGCHVSDTGRFNLAS